MIITHLGLLMLYVHDNESENGLDEIYITRLNAFTVWITRGNKFIEPLARIPPWGLHSPGSFCDKCGVTFTTQHALLRHITSKHEEPRSSTAYCNICQRFFKTKWSLATHNSKYHRNWDSRILVNLYIRIGSRHDRDFENLMKWKLDSADTGALPLNYFIKYLFQF